VQQSARLGKEGVIVEGGRVRGLRAATLDAQMWGAAMHLPAPVAADAAATARRPARRQARTGKPSQA
jgi:hypothetical protein